MLWGRLGDHPRSRGVYTVLSRLKRTVAGSSPLARGLLFITAYARKKTGIIPARAGFTSECLLWTEPAKDHPRSRGVYRHGDFVNIQGTGSSPLARGLLHQGLPKGSGLGIIPARAGFTRARSSRWFASTDHPRSRGVYPGHHDGDRGPYGSSPLARGLHG